MPALEGGRISNRQVLLLCTTLVLGTAVLFAPAITAREAGRDAWLSLAVVSTLFGLLVVWAVIRLGLRFPGRTLVEYAPEILGPILGKVVAAVFILGLVHFNSVIVREFGDFLLSAFMPETPLLVFNATLVLLAAWGVRGGLETIARANEFSFLVLFLSLFIIFGLVLPDIDFSRLVPVLDEGIKPVIKGGLAPSGFRGEIVIMLLLLPYVRNPRKTSHYLAGAVLLIGVVLTIATVISTAVLGILAEHLVFPYFSLARYIAVGEILERMEALILIMWVAGVTIKTAIFLYAAALGTAQFFGLRDYRPVVTPLGLITLVWSIALFDNTREAVYWLSNIFPPYAIFFELFVPVLLLTVAVFRGKGGGGK